MGMNWNTRTGRKEPLVRQETMDKAKRVRELRRRGLTYAEIGDMMGISRSRAWELNQDPEGGDSDG